MILKLAKIRIAIVAGLLLVTTGCDVEEKTAHTDNNVLVEKRNLTIQLPSKSKVNEIETFQVEFIAKIDKKTGELISKEVSENLLDFLGLDSEESLENFIVSKDYRNNALRAIYSNHTPIFNNQNFRISTARESGHSKCIEDCNSKYTAEDGSKVKGRGACKFNCWVDTIMELLDDIKDLIK